MLLADVAAAAGACSAPWSSVSSSSGVEFACSGEGVLFAIRALSVGVHPQPLLSAEFATCSIPRQIAVDLHTTPTLYLGRRALRPSLLARC